MLSSNQSLAVNNIICLTDGSGVDEIMYRAQETRLPSLYAGRSQITCLLLINDILWGSDNFDDARRNPDKEMRTFTCIVTRRRDYGEHEISTGRDRIKYFSKSPHEIFIKIRWP